MPNFRKDDSVKFRNPMAWLKRELMQFGLEVFCKRYYGIYRATVIDNEDPKGLGRVRAICPAVGHRVEEDVNDNYWAYPCLPGVGADPDTGQMAGVWFVPDVGANVYFQFEGGDPAHPIWTGGWVPETRQMPELESDGEVYKGIRTRSGHYLRFSDESGDVHITMAKGDGSGSQTASFFTMDKNGNVALSNDKGSIFVMNAVDNQVTVIAANDDGETESMVTMGVDSLLLSTKSSGTVEINGKDITLNGGVVTMNCEKFNVNSQAVYLGQGAAEPAILGNKMMLHQTLHMHPTAAPGSPTGPPLPPPLILGKELSMKVFVA